MISFSFGNEAFNKEYGESTIDIVIASKSKYIAAENFFQAAICYLDEVTYVGYKVADDYKDAYLKLGKNDFLGGEHMEKSFKTDDIRKLYSAFISLCDYVEEVNGCGKCPLWAPMCGNEEKKIVNEFSEALARIRETAGISKP